MWSEVFSSKQPMPGAAHKSQLILLTPLCVFGDFGISPSPTLLYTNASFFFFSFSSRDNHVKFPTLPSIFYHLGSFPPTSPQYPPCSLAGSVAEGFPSIFLSHPARGRAASSHLGLGLALHSPLPASLCPEDAPAIPLPCPAATVPFVSPTPGASPPHGPASPPARVLYSPWPFPVPLVHLNQPADSGV